MRHASRLLVFGLLPAALMLPPAVRAQVASESCPLGVRTSPARAEGACLSGRLTPLPPSPLPFPSPASTGWATIPLRSVVDWRTGYPVDRNNGAAWSGRGGSTSISGGVAWRWKWLSGALQPVAHGSGNQGFTLPDTLAPGQSHLAYPWGPGTLDWFLRPGDGARAELDPGDSFVEADLGWGRTGVSHERLWWGPARRYPLLFSGTAGGFPHAYLATGRDLRTYAGTFSGQILWGRLDESDWLDADPRNDLRLLTAFQVRWQVDYVPGLEFSYAVARHEPLAGRSLRWGQLFQVFTGDPDGEDPGRRGMPMGTVSARLSLPDAGLEVYGQLGRGEGFLNPDPGVSDTRLSRVYVLGFSHSDTTSAGQRWRVSAELVRQALDEPQPAASRPESDPVLLRAVRQGHTHRGQLLGAYIGPGSNAQYLAFDRVADAWKWGVFVERIRRDDDAYFRDFVARYGFRGHDLEWTLGVRGGGWLDLPSLERVIGPLAMGAEVGVSRRKNRNFIGLRDQNFVFLREWNVSADIYFEWDPRLRP